MAKGLNRDPLTPPDPGVRDMVSIGDTCKEQPSNYRTSPANRFRRRWDRGRQRVGPGEFGSDFCEIMNMVWASCPRLTPDAYANIVIHVMSIRCRGCWQA